MAIVRLADIIQPEYFSQYLTEQSMTSTALFQNGVLVPNFLMEAEIGNGGACGAVSSKMRKPLRTLSPGAFGKAPSAEDNAGIAVLLKDAHGNLPVQNLGQESAPCLDLVFVNAFL